MSRRSVSELLLLAAIWGASFLFMRLSIGEFGALPLAGIRSVGAAVLLVPILLWRDQWPVLRQNAGPIAVVGLIGTAVPFTLYGISAHALNAGTMSILNATTPLWGAVIVWHWFGERLSALRVLGLLLGLVGVAWLAWDTATSGASAPGGHAPVAAVAACLGATFCYGFVAAYTRRRLTGCAPMAVAAGSQISAALVLAVPALLNLPTTAPNLRAWLSALALAFACTGIAYILYFRLIAHIGAARATTVTFLIPLFAVLWGVTLLSEPVTPAMLVAGALILMGTALSTGLVSTTTFKRVGG